MKIKGIIDEDYLNYYKPAMTIMMPFCSFKCDKECGQQVCQNSALADSKTIELPISNIIERYIKNDITESICFMGLEPFDSAGYVFLFIKKLRKHYHIQDDVVIYTGYNKDEIQDKVEILKQFKNIIIKYGRFIPNQKPHKDEILGVKLASDNQYAERISYNNDRNTDSEFYKDNLNCNNPNKRL